MGTVTIAARGISSPAQISTGPDGNLWFTNAGNNSIGRITPAGAVATFTGSGISQPGGIAAGPDGNLWFTNIGNNSIGRITPAGAVANFTGPGINSPGGITAGPDGNLWFTNAGNNSIGRITPAGIVANFTYSGPGIGISQPAGITAGPDGNLWFTNIGNNSIGRITPAGTAENFTTQFVNHPSGITAGPDGNLWFTNRNTNYLEYSVGRITPAGIFADFHDPTISSSSGITAGPDGNLWFTNAGNNSIGRITTAGAVANFGPGISTPRGITAGPDGNLWFTNWGNNTIGRITPTGIVESFTGNGMSRPQAITAGPDGNLWFTNNGNNSIGRITTAGAVTNFVGTGIKQPFGITAGPDGNLWFTNSNAFTTTNSSIGRITPTGVATDFTDPSIIQPYGITAGPDGNLWFTNRSNNSIGRITPTGIVSNYTDPSIMAPQGIAAGTDGNLWFTNSGNNSIGRISPAGIVENLTGDGINHPSDITAGPDGDLWFTTAFPNNAIGRITPTGIVATYSGAGINQPYGITAGPDGNVWFTNDGNSSIAYVGTQVGAAYHAVVPTRALDSRTANGGWNTPLAAGTPRDVQITGLGGPASVPAGSKAVVLNVTATNASAGSFLTVWPTGVTQPNASNLNFGAGQTIANLVTVKLGAGGKVSFADAVGSVDVIADVVGYYDDGTGPGDLYRGMTPTRLLDSRGPNGGWDGKLLFGIPRDLTVRQPDNPSGVPATATAVIANVTVTDGSAGSFVSVWPSGVTQPNVSNLNFGAGQTIANLAIVQIGSNGKISFANAVGNVDVIVDVIGYFDPTGGSRFHAISPTRILDDRVGTGLQGPWGPAQTRPLSVAGATGTNVPGGATGLVANVTATNGTAGSFVTVFADGVTKPNASNLNFGPGQTIPNLVTVYLPASGTIDLSNELGNVDLVADVAGFYAPS